VTIPAGAKQVVVNIFAIDDDEAESTETIVIKVADGSGYEAGLDNETTISLFDNDQPDEICNDLLDNDGDGEVDEMDCVVSDALPVVSIVATEAAASEKGEQAGSFTIGRTGDVSATLYVLLTRAGTASYYTDYKMSPASAKISVTFPVGVNSIDIDVLPNDDAAVEGAETVELSINASSAYELAGTASATVTIADRGEAIYVLDRVEIGKYVAANDLCGDTMSCIHTIDRSSFTTRDQKLTLSEGSGKYIFTDVYDITGETLSDYQVDFSFSSPPSMLTGGDSFELSASATQSGYTGGWYLLHSFTYYYAYSRNGYRTSAGWQYDTQVAVFNRDMPYDADTGKFSGGTPTVSNSTTINIPQGLYDEIEIGGRLGWDPGINIVWFYRLED
jgi:hypothetical protein